MLYRVSFNKIGAEYTRCFTDRAERDKFAEDMRKAGYKVISINYMLLRFVYRMKYQMPRF